jgi:hypothetical protein
MKKIAVSIIIMIALISGITIISLGNNDVNNSQKIGALIKQLLNTEYGSNASQRRVKGEEELYAVADDFNITKEELEIQKSIYELSGSKNPEKKAFNRLSTRKTLYALAEKNDCIVDDKEVEAYITDLRNTIENSDSDSKKEYLSLIDVYGGEDAYWKQAKELYKQSLSIKKYLDEERTIIFGTSDNAKDDDSWNDYKEKLIQNAIEAENIQIVE